MNDLTAAHLFDGQGEAFAALAKKAQRYAEYGCGASTVWVAENTGAAIKSVDTSQEWVDAVHAQVAPRAHFDLATIDLGPVKNWGWPLSYAHKERFRDYFFYIWNDDYRPDLVLIDGRFRLACFFACMLKAEPGTTIIFDDYTDRPHYHLAADVLKPVEIRGRQAIFLIPNTLDKDLAKTLLNKFEYVMD